MKKSYGIVRFLIVIAGELISIYGLYIIFLGAIQGTFGDATVNDLFRNVAIVLEPFVLKVTKYLNAVTVIGFIIYIVGTILRTFIKWEAWDKKMESFIDIIGVFYLLGYIIIAKKFSLPILAPLFQILIVVSVVDIIFSLIKSNYYENNKSSDIIDRYTESFN